MLLGDVSKIKTGNLDVNAKAETGRYPFFTCAQKPEKINSYSFDCECVLVAGNGDLNVKYYKGKFDVYQRTYVVEVLQKDRIDTRFLFYFLNKYLVRLRSQSIGGVIKYIKMANLTDIELPKYSLKKQKQIIQILDTADNLRQKCKEQLALLEDYLKSVFIKIFGDSISNDKKWPLVELNSIIENIDSGWSPVCVDNHRESEDVPVVLKLGAVTYCVFNQSEYKIIPKGINIKKRVEVQSKDLLFTRKNTKDLVGASVYVFKCERNLLLPDTIFRLNYKNTLVSGIYLWKLFTEKGFRKLIQNLATGSAGSMPNISKEKLKKLRIPLPSLNIQNKFASIVEQVEKTKQKMRASLGEMDNHFNALMQRYFE